MKFTTDMDCYYCLKRLADVVAQGCGSKEFPPARVNELCEVYQIMIRRKG